MNADVLICAGLFRSASTWAFNCALGLARLQRFAQSGYADNVLDLRDLRLDPARIAVIKSHFPTRSLLGRTNAMPPVVVSVREPLDAVASGMQQFDWTFDVALSRIRRSAVSCVAISRATPSLVIRYEDPRSRTVDGISRLARHLGLVASIEDVEAIGNSLRPDVVGERIRAWERAGRFDDRPKDAQYDAETHWHPNHVGDGRQNKFIDMLTLEQIADVKRATRAFRRYFGYETPKVSWGTQLSRLLTRRAVLPHCDAICDRATDATGFATD